MTLQFLRKNFVRRTALIALSASSMAVPLAPAHAASSYCERYAYASCTSYADGTPEHGECMDQFYADCLAFECNNDPNGCLST